VILVSELPDGQATIWCKNIPEKLNTLCRVHARHRRQTDGFAMPLAKRNVVSHVWLKWINGDLPPNISMISTKVTC